MQDESVGWVSIYHYDPPVQKFDLCFRCGGIINPTTKDCMCNINNGNGIAPVSIAIVMFLVSICF